MVLSFDEGFINHHHNLQLTYLEKPPKDNAQTDILHKLGLEACRTTPLDPVSMLDISTWALENHTPLEPKDLPNAFLRRLWLLSRDARSPCCQHLNDALNNSKSPEEMLGGSEGENQGVINPLDLVTAVFMSANTFLQQEITMRMAQCQFAVPLVLPNIDPEEASHFLLWPLRAVMSQWKSHTQDNNSRVQEGDLARTCMAVVSCVKLGHCSVSKSQVLNHVLSGLRSDSETFLHRGMDGGQLPRRLSNGLVEVGWSLPTDDIVRDVFPVPVAIANLRGDASTHEKCLSLLCQASSAVVVFCGDLREKDRQLLAFCKDTASKLILVDLADAKRNENRAVGFVDENLEEDMKLSKGLALPGRGLSEEELANKLRDTLKNMLPDELKLVTLEAAAKLAVEVGLNVDEGSVCKKAMAAVEEMLNGLDEGSDEFRQKQLPLQGHLWTKLAELEKEESKQRKECKDLDPKIKKAKKDILAELSSYEMTPTMKIFTDSLFTTDKVERTYFLTWIKLRLQLMQTKKQNSPQDLLTDLPKEKTNDAGLQVSQQQSSWSQSFEPNPSSLGLEHFLREMGLIFELTHISPGSGSHNVLRLPSLAADLLLYGIPLELMDGDASNIPIHWLSSVFAELKHRLPQEQCRTRVLTNLGIHHARNAEVLSALFGVKFPEGRKRSTCGVYMVALCLPDNLRSEMECDFLLLIDVEGLCSVSLDSKRNALTHNNEMATVAAGLSDVLLQNISSHASCEFETHFTIIVNALLRIKESGSMPICQLLLQDEGIKSLLQASQLRHVSEMLQIETEDSETSSVDKYSANMATCSTCIKGPWSNMSLSEPVDTQYSNAVLKLKKNLFEALKDCATKSKASSLPEFTRRLCAVWDSVKTESFTIGLQNTEIALAFSLLCTEFSMWVDGFLENIESWLMLAAKKIFDTKAKALDAAVQNELLSELKNEAREEIKTEIDKVRSRVDAYLMQDDLKMSSETFRPALMSNIANLQNRVTEETMQKLETVNESHCSSTQLKNFETLLEKEQESKLQALVEKSRSTKILLQDTEIEEEFEGVWSKTLSNFDFRPSEKGNITARVAEILKQNLISRGLQKHMKKLEITGQSQTDSFQVYNEHFGYRSRLRHMFEDNNRLQRLGAQEVACNIIEEYNQFVANKCSLTADFSDSYITEMLENVEKALKEKSMDIRSAFEVDLKVHLCNAACQDFQKLHDRYAKDRELLTVITANKGMYLAKFIYRFRKRDECQRVASAFSSMVIKPTVLDYINRPLGMQVAEEIQAKAQQFKSPQAFHQSLLEELIKEDRFEKFLQYLLSYDDFRRQKIQETVVAHLSESTNLNKQRQQRLGDIVGKIAAAISQTAEGTNGVLSDTKPLLERTCLILEKDGDVDVNRDSLIGPAFSITTEWDCFVKCLMELLATMRLDLAQEFSQNVDVPQLLHSLPVQPQDSLFNRVRGCDKQCPRCRAPCEEDGVGHEVHKALFHWPKGMLPDGSCSMSCISFLENMGKSKLEKNQDTQVTSKDLQSLAPYYPNFFYYFSP
uniref:GTPase, very large interferon inducible 1-like 2 n=1 Tax=Acanthochromis polyacanthus TaxID=80966 RepID=A0A3Q1GYG9_9TELE